MHGPAWADLAMFPGCSGPDFDALYGLILALWRVQDTVVIFLVTLHYFEVRVPLKAVTTRLLPSSDTTLNCR